MCITGVYERAIQELSDADSREICLEYAEVETKLGEVRVVRVTSMHISVNVSVHSCAYRAYL